MHHALLRMEKIHTMVLDTYEGSNPSTGPHLLDLLTLPMLRDLRIESSISRRNEFLPYHRCFSLLIRSSRALTKLSMNAKSLTEDQLIEWLRLTPLLTTLDLWELNSAHPFSYDVTSQMTHRNPGQPFLVPRLENLKLRGLTRPHPKLCIDIMNMIESRWRLRVVSDEKAPPVCLDRVLIAVPVSYKRDLCDARVSTRLRKYQKEDGLRIEMDSSGGLCFFLSSSQTDWDGSDALLSNLWVEAK